MVVDCSQSSTPRRLLDARALHHPAVHQHQLATQHQLQPLIAVVAKRLSFPKLLLHAATVEPPSIREASPPHRLFHQHLLQQHQPPQHQLLLQFLPRPLLQQLQQLLSRQAMFQRRNSVTPGASLLLAGLCLSLVGVRQR